MSVLDSPAVAEITPAMRQAAQIKQSARSAYQHLVTVFNNGSKQFWRNPQASPSQIAAALGTDAAEVFELHAKLGAFLASIRPEAIQEGIDMVGQFTCNQDGTVTINLPQMPAPSTTPGNA